MCSTSTVTTDNGFNVHKHRANELFKVDHSTDHLYAPPGTVDCKNDYMLESIPDLINNMEIEYLFGGGYYEFALTDPEQEYSDMTMCLLLKSIDNYEHLKILR